MQAFSPNSGLIGRTPVSRTRPISARIFKHFDCRIQPRRDHPGHHRWRVSWSGCRLETGI
jgi:hypothetical protein